MRVTKAAGDFSVKAIAGTHTILMALDCAEDRRRGLLGFAFKRETVGTGKPQEKWLNAQKVFRSIVPNPKEERDPQDRSQPRRFSTWEHPVQSFLWGEYTAEPNTLYKFTVVPMYGEPDALKPAPELEFEIRTEKEFDQGHGVWFNRGAIASQAFARKFGNKPPGNQDDENDEETKWLSRGLLAACLRFIRETPPGDGLRVAAYEFTYKPVVDALKKALDDGVDVRIVYHDTSKEEGKAKAANEKAIAAAGLTKKIGSRQVLFPRTKTKIPHNKFIVRLKGGKKPTTVWTGSTNFTPSGFLGQTNVGHWVEDEETAQQYLDYWELLKTDPDRDDLREAVLKLTPNPPALISEKSVARVFSPRAKADLLKWYSDRVEDAIGSIMFTAAFGVAKQLVPSIVADRDCLRFILMEKPPTKDLEAELKKDRRDLLFSYGDVLGEMYMFKNGKPTARRRIQEFDLDKWFMEEEHYRKKNEGFVFFIHTKFLLIDPLSGDPLVCSGSANFSSNSLLQNDENMLLVRGDTRVADIYMTEFDRIFRHFYFRNIANQIEAKGGEAEGAFLDETDKWTNSYFNPKSFKTRRRELFFGDSTKCWVAGAGARPAGAAKAPKKKAKGTAKKTRAKAKAKPKKKIAKTKAAGKSKAKSAKAKKSGPKKTKAKAKTKRSGAKKRRR